MTEQQKLRDVAWYLRMYVERSDYDVTVIGFEGPKEARVLVARFQWIAPDELYGFNATMSSSLFMDPSMRADQIADILCGIGCVALDRVKSRLGVTT